jgi:hypothetical protein
MALQTTLISVTIVYCKNGKQFQKEVDLAKAGGLWWNDGTGKNEPHNYPPGKTAPLHTDCAKMVVAGGSACWWDNQKNEWVCPDGLGG